MVVEPQIAMRQEQVDHVDGHDRGADRVTHGDAHAGGTAAGGVAVVAVDQDDHDREHEHLAEGPEHVARWQELVEVVVVGARTLPVVLGHGQPGGEVRGEQPDDVERDDRDQAGDDPGGHQERHRGDRHHLERVDLLGDPHGTELGGEAAAHSRGERDAGHQRRDLTGVEVRRDEAGERGGADLVEGGVPGEPDLRAREEGHRRDDADGAADDGQARPSPG